MNGPGEGFRAHIVAVLDEMPDGRERGGERVVTRAMEDYLDGVLAEIEGRMTADIESDSGQGDLRDPRDAERNLAAIESWLSLASYAYSAVYAPQSPLPRGLAGVAERSVERLRKITRAAAAPLRVIARILGTDGFAIGVAYPWGISVSVNWNV